MKFNNLLKSLASQSPVEGFKHSAIVLRGGAILSVGINGNERHAEEAALKQLWPSERKGTTILSFRLRKSGAQGLAKPCPKCQKLLESSGVKTVVYSLNDSGWVKERI